MTTDTVWPIPRNEVKRLPLVFSVEEEEGEGKAEPNADKAQLLLGRRQGCVDHLISNGISFPVQNLIP